MNYILLVLRQTSFGFTFLCISWYSSINACLATDWVRSGFKSAQINLTNSQVLALCPRRQVSFWDLQFIQFTMC